ncbi:MAG: 16S rRNA (uracil(1498)-N(3))-methyltransferase [Kiritimatiellae bacterium]|nr:16S rRNA (uracil(1498)-N(3))-methyltransferase [Kiritimatiellia bacterium]
MHRLLVPSEQLASDSPVLPKEAANHLKVLRPKDGEEIELFDGSGKSRRFSVEGGGKNFRLAALSPVCAALRAPWSLTLFACVTKGSRWDWTIEKATELGVTRIVPVVSARTIVRIGADEREAKRARWIRIAEDAARQSDAKWIPEIHEPVSFAESLPLVRETTCFVGALTNPPPRPMVEAMRSSCGRLGDAPLPDSPRSFAVYVGPEGDFSPEELAALIDIATPVSFGSTILRAETAAIYGVSVLKSFLDAAYSTTP